MNKLNIDVQIFVHAKSEKNNNTTTIGGRILKGRKDFKNLNQYYSQLFHGEGNLTKNRFGI